MNNTSISTKTRTDNATHKNWTRTCDEWIQENDTFELIQKGKPMTCLSSVTIATAHLVRTQISHDIWKQVKHVPIICNTVIK